MLLDTIILFHIAPFLTLGDVVIYMSTCKQINKLAGKLLNGVKCVTVPDTYILRFMRRLTKKCPNVTNLSMRITVRLSSEIVKELNKLPLVSFECIKVNLSTEDEDNDVIYDGKDLKLPELKKLYISDPYRFDSHSEKLSSLRMTKTGPWCYKTLRKYNLKELIIDSYDRDFPNEKLFYFPVAKIDMAFSKRLIDCANFEVLKSLRLTNIGKEYASHEVIQALKKLQLRELEMPYIKGIEKLILCMPLETLCIRHVYGFNASAACPPLNNKTIKTLSIYDQNVDFVNLVGLPSLNTLILDHCNIGFTCILPIKNLELLGCNNIPERIEELPIVSLIIRNTDDKVKMHFPKSLQTLILSDLEGDYSNFPELPNLTKLHIEEMNHVFKNHADREIDSDDDLELIPDEAFRIMAKSPIRDLKIAGASLCDRNVRYFAKTPINYLNIKFTRVTAAGLMALKGLPLRKLIIPNIPAYQIF